MKGSGFFNLESDNRDNIGRTLPMLPGCRGAAEFDDNNAPRYRYWLMRDWGDEPWYEKKPPLLLSIGMNPSSADYALDDPTIRCDIRLAQREGYSVMVKVNVMDLITTYPSRLLDAGAVPCSLENRLAIAVWAKIADRIVCCWGTLPPTLRPHADTIVGDLLEMDRPLWCLGYNKDRSPRHPLRLLADTPLEPYVISG